MKEVYLNYHLPCVKICGGLVVANTNASRPKPDINTMYNKKTDHFAVRLLSRHAVSAKF